MWIFTLIKCSDILPLLGENLNNSFDSYDFSVRGYLPLIWNDSVNHMHGLVVYVKKALPFVQDSKEFCEF